MPATQDDMLDGITTSVAVKAPVLVTTTAAITLYGAQTIDGVAVAETTPLTRVLVKDQTDATENGIYSVYNTGWVRALDFNGPRDAVRGTLVFETNGARLMRLYCSDSVVVFGTTELFFYAFNPGSDSFYTLESFGAVGDGATDDTLALQNAIDFSAGNGVTVYGRKTATYRVQFRLTQSSTRTALIFKNNMSVKLRGGTIKMKDGQGHTCVAQSLNFTTDTLLNAEFEGVVDGNSANQTVTPGGTFSPTLLLNRPSGCKFDFVVNNAIFAQLYVSGPVASIVNNTLVQFKGDTCKGSGLHLDGTNWTLGPIDVRNCAYFDSNAEGNPFIGQLLRTQGTTAYFENFGYGPKLQNGSDEVTFSSIIMEGGANNLLVNEFGMKFQGTPGAGRLGTIKVGRLVVRNIPGIGLYVTNAEDISIDSYSGSSNDSYNDATLGNRTDIYVANNSNLRIGMAVVTEFGYCALKTNATESTIHIQSMRASSTKSTIENGCFWDLLGGRVTIDKYEVVPTATKVLGATDFTSAPTQAKNFLRIGHLIAKIDTTAYFTGSPTSLFNSAAGDMCRIDKITIPGFIDRYRNLALTANSTTTVVNNNPTFFWNGGDCGTYIECVPASSPAITLAGAVGRFPIVPRQMSAGGGFVITHASDPTPGTVAVWINHAASPFAGPEA